LPDDGEPSWYTGGQLADDLTLPRLQRQWKDPEDGEVSLDDDLTPEERQAFYDDAARAAAHATSQIRRHLVTNPYAAEDACWAASDALHAAARVTGNRQIRRSADAYDRAARAPYGRIPRPSPAGNALRTTARLLMLAGVQDRTTVSIVLLTSRLLALLETITQIRMLQHRQAQADAARCAHQHLERGRTRVGRDDAAWPSEASMPSQVKRAMVGFPSPWAPGPLTVPARTPRTSPHRPVPGRGGP
jgi:hypothetical protein